MKNVSQIKYAFETSPSESRWSGPIPQSADNWPQAEASNPPSALVNGGRANSADSGEQTNEAGFECLEPHVEAPALPCAQVVRPCADISRAQYPGGGCWSETSSLQPLRRRDRAVKRAKVLTQAQVAEFEEYIRSCCAEGVVARVRLIAGLRPGEVAALKLDTLGDAYEGPSNPTWLRPR